MQLVAYGAQDIYLTGNPMITFFKVVYRRHTNFAMESIQQTFNGTVEFGNRVTCTISRNGDLVSGAYVRATLPTLEVAPDAADPATAGEYSQSVRWVDCVGHYLLKEVEVEIGGQLIDRHYADWLEIWAQLTCKSMSGYLEMIGQDAATHGLQIPGTSTKSGMNTDATDNRVIHVPLQFWFCRNVGLALPLIALQYHEVRVTITFEDLKNLNITHDNTTTGITAAGAVDFTIAPSLDASLWVDYIYLDTDERRRFAQVSHEYLIEQLQFHGNESYNNASPVLNLNFNHPVKELVWVARSAQNSYKRQWNNYTTRSVTEDSGFLARTPNPAAAVDTNKAPRPHCRPIEYVHVTDNAANPTGPIADGFLPNNLIQTARLQLNGHDRFATRNGTYFNKVQTCAHHTNVPCSPGINVYSFALRPEDHQPSGTCNFSRIDNSRLHLTLKSENTAEVAQADGGNNVTPAGSNTNEGVIKVFATNYNVLRIMSGMGGLAYSN